MFDINAPHWHLLLNHMPVVGILAAVLLLIYSLIRRNSELQRAAMLSLVLVAILSFFAHMTGDDAAHALRNDPTINKSDVREHSQASDYALDTSIVLGVIALAGLVMGWRSKDVIVETNGVTGATNSAIRNYNRHHKAPPMVFLIMCLLIGLLDVAILLRVAYLGGIIRHPEIRAVPTVPTT